MSANRIDDSFLISPNWQAPKGVNAFMTTRNGGVSQMPYASMNLGASVGDDLAAVDHNMQRLRLTFLTQEQSAEKRQAVEPVFLNQTHGITVAELDNPQMRERWQAGETLEADASICTTPGIACVVRVADCMPILFAVPHGVAATHAGWRGLAGGIVEATVQKLLSATGCQASDVVAWLGPCIGPILFEVGADVREAFIAQHEDNRKAFQPAIHADKWFANLPWLGRMALERLGVQHVYTDGRCTFTEENLFFSYRRDHFRYGGTGRMAACIWLQQICLSHK